MTEDAQHANHIRHPRIRTGAPRVARCKLADAPYLTFTDGTRPWQYRYAIIGTEYGWLHTAGGDIRFWLSANGARHHLRNHIQDRCYD